MHPDLDEFLAAERQLEGDPLHRRLGPGLVEHEVAQRVPDRLALVDLHRAGPVGVVADDHVRPAVDDHPGQLLLVGEGRRVVLGAPVRVDDDEVGAGLARGRHVRLDVLGREPGAADLRGGRVVGAGDRVVAEDRDLRPRRLRGWPACAPRPGSCPAPETAIPRFVTFAIVWRMPAPPASLMWLLASET